ncbi:uncharacterized protein TNCT_119311 [Trichonephila clavata]|uniref:Gustatory receptor n=1 Tax=Trichonephila clavata TaxID=2740835 RepID=A0A8X6IN92_TRICU|nr:uncharacterized protein TNCT_119311 [Trichonephila clavata]
MKYFLKKDLRNCIPRFILSYFRWAGFVDASGQLIKTSFVSYTLDFIVLFTCIDTLISILVSYDSSEVKLDIIFMSSLALTTIVWYRMRYKKKSTTNFLQKFDGTSSHSHEKKFNVLVFLTLCIPAIYSACIICGMNKSEAGLFFIYGYEIEYISIQNIIVAIKSFCDYTVYPTFGNIVALLYIFLCLHCSDYLNNLTRKVDKYSPKDFTPSKQIDILKGRAEIYDILVNTERIFSFPIFSIIVANVLMLSSISGSFLISDWSNTEYIWKIERIFYGTNACLYVTSILWAAGTVSIEMRKFKEIFHYKTHLKLLCKYSEEQLHLKMDLMNEPDFLLTGWNVIHLGRSTILCLIGTLLTYTVLVINTHGEKEN